MPYLNDTKLAVAFENIKINADNQLVEGVVRTGYDQLWEAVMEVPIIKTLNSTINVLEQVFKKQKEITEKQENLDKQLSENKIDKEKYKREQENLIQQIAQNDKSLEAVSLYIGEAPAIPQANKENAINQIKAFKSQGSKQSFNQGKADDLLTIFNNFKKQENEQFIADFERIIQNFEGNEHSKILFLDIELDTVTKKILDHKFAAYILPDKENDYQGKYFGDFKLAKEGNTRYIWEGNYWTKIIDNKDGTYSAIVFSTISSDIIETVSWSGDDSQIEIVKKIKSGKDTADYISKITLVAPLVMDINPTFGANKIVARVKLVKPLVSQIGKNSSKLVKKLDLGKFVKKIGDYEVYENGEVFYRAIPESQLDDLIKTGIMKVPLNEKTGTYTSEMFISPTLKYIKETGYEGVIIKFKMEKGTLAKLEKIGTVKKTT